MTAMVSLNSSVQGQGIKLDTRDWMDMGSPTWPGTTEQMKALAYQAAICHGWTDAGLRKAMIDEWSPRVDTDQADFTLEFLRELAAKYPADVEELRQTDAVADVFKFRGIDKTFPFPGD